MAEARIAASVRYPNVAAVHDLVEHGGSCWLVMEYHGGGTVATLLRDRRRLPPPVVAALACSCSPRCGRCTPPASCTVT